MTRLVDGLERDGLAERAGDPEDARAVLVRATPAGVRVLTEGRRRRVAAFAEVLNTLPREDLGRLARGVDVLERALR